MADDFRVGFITFARNHPGSDPVATIGVEQNTPSGKKYRKGNTGWFNSGGDTRANISVMLFPDGRGTMAGEFKTESSSTGDLIHLNIGFYGSDGQILAAAPSGSKWEAPGRKIYPRDGAVPFSQDFTYSTNLYDLIATFKVRSAG